MSRATALIAPLLLISLGAAWADPAGQPAADLIRDLGEGGFKTREAAEKALVEAPADAESVIQEATHSKDPEVAARAEHILLLRSAKHPLSPKELAAALKDHPVTCVGFLSATSYGDNDYRDWRLSPIAAKYADESQSGQEVRIPLQTYRDLVDLRPLLYAEVEALGLVRVDAQGQCSLELREVRPHHPGFDEKLPMLTARAAQFEREKRHGTEVVLVGRLQRGGVTPAGAGDPASFSLAAPGAEGWTPVELSGNLGMDLAPLVGKNVAVRGFLREARYCDGMAPAPFRYTYLRARDLREAAAEDLKKAADAPEGAVCPPVKTDPVQGENGGGKPGGLSR